MRRGEEEEEEEEEDTCHTDRTCSAWKRRDEA
jgi:hypothetical protein